MLQLEESFAPLGVDIVADRRAAQRDRLAQYLLQRSVQFAQLSASERRRSPARPDTGAKQRLVGIDVAHAAQQLLVQQRALDRRLAVPEQSDESLELRSPAARPRSGKSRAVARRSILTTASRPKRRGSTKRSSRPEASLSTAWVCFAISSSGRRDQQAARSCRDARSIAASGQRLVAPYGSSASRSKTMCLPTRLHARNARMLQDRGDLGGRRLQRLRLFAQPDRFDRCRPRCACRARGQWFRLREVQALETVYGMNAAGIVMLYFLHGLEHGCPRLGKSGAILYVTGSNDRCTHPQLKHTYC